MSEVTTEQETPAGGLQDTEQETPQDTEESTEQEGAETTVPELTFDEKLDNISEGERLTKDRSWYREIHDGIVKLGALVINADKRLEGAIFRMAESMAAVRATIILPSTYPDWAANSTAYQIIAEGAKDEAFGKLDKLTRRRIGQRVRNTMHRTVLESVIRSYVAESTEDPTDTEDPKRTFKQTGHDTDESPAFLAAVRRHYISTQGMTNELTLPARYMSQEEKTEAARKRAVDAEPPNPKTVALSGVETLNQMTFQLHTAAALRVVSDVVRRITDPATGGLENPAQIADDLGRIADLATYAVKRLNHATNEPNDHDRAVAIMWGADDESRVR